MEFKFHLIVIITLILKIFLIKNILKKDEFR